MAIVGIFGGVSIDPDNSKRTVLSCLLGMFFALTLTGIIIGGALLMNWMGKK